MAQLSDDCFAFNGPLLPVAEAERLIAERIVPVTGREIVTLANAAGRVLADDVVAPVNLPPFDNSAVDGFAVRAADLDGERECRLTIADRVAAGHAASAALKAGEAIRIFTGAPMPAGADTVFMQEDCRVKDGAVIVPPGLRRGANTPPRGRRHSRRRRGAPGRPAARGAACRARGGAGLGRARGAPPRAHRRCSRPATRSSNRARNCRAPRSMIPTVICLAGLIARLGAEVTDLGILKDDRPALASAIAAAAVDHDLVLTSGGVSTGEADHVRARTRKHRPACVLAAGDKARPTGGDGRHSPPPP